MGEIIEVSIIMWIVAIAAFAPLGYFIYLFTIGNGESFGKSNPADHSVENKKYYKIINDVMSAILGDSEIPSSAPAATQAKPQSASTSAFEANPSTAAKKSTSGTGRKKATTTRKRTTAKK